MIKKCNSCKVLKDISEFWKCNGTSDGRQYDCIACMKAHWKERVTNNEAKRAQYRENNKQRDDRNIADYLYRMAKKRAALKGLEFSITVDHIKEVLVELCPIRQVKMFRNRGKLTHDSFSLDRVDSSKGYVPGNIRVISWLANNAKLNLSSTEIERLYLYSKGEL